ncbi:pseudouridine synthase [Alteromonas sp. S167]|uniref:pseudouridine synthase n=1 Tax=Alteromonas sp. S167 TaxID=3117402 RepID=UPI002FE0E2C5
MQDLCILYNSDDLVVVNKPSGIGMHDTQAVQNSSLTSQQFPSTETSAQETLTIPGIVTLLKKQLNLSQLHLCHRLDTGTSGCLCLAKNERTAAEIGELFKTRAVGKYYVALSESKPKKKQGAIIGDMKNRRGGQRILLKTTEKPAITQFFSQSAKPGVRGFIVKPFTGKTHQIRVALKSIGAPINGDTLYGGNNSERLNLHAWRLMLPLKTGLISVSANIETRIALFEKNGFTLMQYEDGFADPQIQEWFSQLQPPENLPWPNLPKGLSPLKGEILEEATVDKLAAKEPN